jgi:hypothetical protein
MTASLQALRLLAGSAKEPPVRVPAPAEMKLAAEPARQLVKPAAGFQAAQADTDCLLLKTRLSQYLRWVNPASLNTRVKKGDHQRLHHHAHMVAAVKAARVSCRLPSTAASSDVAASVKPAACSKALSKYISSKVDSLQLPSWFSKD